MKLFALTYVAASLLAAYWLGGRLRRERRRMEARERMIRVLSRC